jgi:hypothetical protein
LFEKASLHAVVVKAPDHIWNRFCKSKYQPLYIKITNVSVPRSLGFDFGPDEVSVGFFRPAGE